MNDPPQPLAFTVYQQPFPILIRKLSKRQRVKYLKTIAYLSWQPNHISWFDFFHFFPFQTTSNSYIYEIEALQFLIGNWGSESGFDNINTQDTSRASNLKLREYTDIAQKTWLYFFLGANEEVCEEEYNNYHHKYRVAARKTDTKRTETGLHSRFAFWSIGTFRA